MNKTKASTVHYMLHETGNLIDQIATRIRSYEWHEWGLPKDKSLLELIAGKDATSALYELHEADSRKANIKLRDLLSDVLKSKDMGQRKAAMQWVMYKWGGIPDVKSEQDESWPEQFRAYEPDVIDSFIANNYKNRVASWSKILAFANQARYAIYDARVAMSLNAMLDEVGYRNRFYVPPPTSTKLKPVFSHIRKYVGENYIGKRPKYLGYFDYMDLLHAMVEKGKADGVLDVEMRIFAHGEHYANSYAEKHGLEIPYPKLKKRPLS